MVDFLFKVIEILLFYGLPLTTTLSFGLLNGAWSSGVSMRRSLLCALALGLTGLVISNTLLWFYGFWQENLRGDIFFAKEPYFLDPFMIRAYSFFILSPIVTSVIATLATLYVLDIQWRRRANSDV